MGATKPTYGTNWYQLSKTYDLKSFLEREYGIEFRGNKCLCAFHPDRNPTMHIKSGKDGDFFNCFSCGAGGDIVTFVQKHDGISSLDAVKKVLTLHGESVDTRELSPEEKAKVEAEQAERHKLIAAKNKRAEKAELTKKAKAIKEMTELSPKLAQNLYEAFDNGNSEIIAEVEKRFPNIYSNTEIRDVYLGWCYDNDSLVIINRDADSGKTYNIKYYRAKCQDYHRKNGMCKEGQEYRDGKWISTPNATTAVLGLEFCDNDAPIFVCEGEKDTLNLLLLGLNAVTLGGVSTSWDKTIPGTDRKYLDVLAGRDVIIWFDHDKAGYVNAILQQKAIKEVSQNCRVVMFHYLGNFTNKYDVSDYLQDKNFATGAAVFDAIAYSTFIVNNYLVDEIIDNYKWTDKEKTTLERLESIKDEEVIKDFYACGDLILKQVKDIKGERDKEVELMTHLSKQMKESRVKQDLQKLINSLFPENSDFIGSELVAIDKIIHFKKSMFTEYRQVHIRDIVMELLRAAKVCGYEFATYRDILYLWTGNYYYGVQKWEIESFIMQHFFYAAKVDYKKHTVKTRNEVVENIYGWATPLEKYIENEVRVVNLLNGVLRVRASGKVTFRNHHKKQDCAMNMLPFNYDAEAKCPKWDKFLKRVVPNEGDRNTIEEFIGYCFLPSHKFESFLVLYGASGANGKSVILEVMRSFFSEENVSSLQLQNFDGHELDALRNKIVNIGAEIEASDLRKSISTLKLLISNKETININPKHKDPYVLKAEEKPKCAFATNKLIKSGADDGGFFRRILYIVFDEEIKDDEKVRDLPERFADEKSGILNAALRGLTRLIKNGKFTMSDKRAEFMDEYKKDVNPVRAYIMDNLKEDSSVAVPKKFIYAHYKEWAEDNGHNVYAVNTFWQKFREQFKFEEKRPAASKFSGNKFVSKREAFIHGWYIDSENIPTLKVGDTDLTMVTQKYSTTNYQRVSNNDFEVSYE